jgi:ABC-2 type transport system ATP-binding protein
VTETFAIEAQGLTRRYDDVLAVDGLDLRVRAGTIYALLGPNGAGKTTTISMLNTLLPPTAGTACVAGFDVVGQAPAVRQRIGVTFQEIVLDRDLTGREVLDYHGQLYGLARRERAKRIDALLALVELEDAAGRLVKGYSGGMKRRLELARGLLTEPEVLFLDEPTQGLDPQNRARIWEYLRAQRAARGLTILLTTHDMEEAGALAGKVGIIDRGRLIAEGSPDELIARIGTEVIRVAGRGDAATFVRRVAGLPFAEEVHRANGLIQIGVDDGSRRLAAIVTTAGETGFDIEDVSVARPTLGDVFLKATGRALRDT